MLEKLRKPGKAKNAFAVVIFGLICFVFVFMGMGYEQMGLTTGGPAALVNKEAISALDFRESYKRMQERAKSYLDKMPAAQRQKFQAKMKSDALNSLVNSMVVAQAAYKLGIRSSDAEIRDYILDIPVFNKDDRFQREFYDNYLKYRQISAEKFEGEIRKVLSSERVRDLLDKSMLPLTPDVVFNGEIERTKINIGYVLIDEKALKEKIVTKSAEVTQYLENKNNEQKISDYYLANKNKYKTEEQVRARHILVKADDKKKDSWVNSLEKIKSIAKEINNDNFAELAKKHSEDTGSKVKGGDLGFFGRKRMVPEFEKVAFSLPPGQVSEPVKTSFGYHIIKVEEKKPVEEKSLEQVQSDIAKDLLKTELYEEQVKQVEEVLQEEDVKKLNSWLMAKGLKWAETGEFALSTSYIPKIGDDEYIINEVLKLKEKGRVVNKPLASSGKRYILQLKDIKIDAAKEKLEEISQNQASNEVFSEWAKAELESSEIVRNEQMLAN